MTLSRLTGWTLACCAALGLALAAPAAKADALDDIVKAKKIRIGIQNEVPPYSQTDENHQPIGYDIDVAKLIAKEMGVELEEVLVSGPNRIPYLLTNKVDLVVATLGITSQRALTIAFSDPYLAFTSVLVGPKKIEVKSLAETKGLKIGVTRGNFQDSYLTKYAPKEAQILRFEDDATTIGALVSGQTDLMGFGDSVTNDVIKKNPGKDLENKFVLTTTTAGSPCGMASPICCVGSTPSSMSTSRMASSRRSIRNGSARHCRTCRASEERRSPHG